MIHNIPYYFPKRVVMSLHANPSTQPPKSPSSICLIIYSKIQISLETQPNFYRPLFFSANLPIFLKFHLFLFSYLGPLNQIYHLACCLSYKAHHLCAEHASHLESFILLQQFKLQPSLTPKSTPLQKSSFSNHSLIPLFFVLLNTFQFVFYNLAVIILLFSHFFPFTIK